MSYVSDDLEEIDRRCATSNSSLKTGKCQAMVVDKYGPKKCITRQCLNDVTSPIEYCWVHLAQQSANNGKIVKWKGPVEGAEQVAFSKENDVQSIEHRVEFAFERSETLRKQTQETISKYRTQQRRL